MINLISAVVATLVGLFYYKLAVPESTYLEWGFMIKHSFVLGLFLYLCSRVSGCDRKVLSKSFFDFCFNVLVSTVFALSLSVLCVYVVDYGRIGRTILLIDAVTYLTLVIIFSIIVSHFGGPMLTIVGSDLSEIPRILNLIKSEHLLNLISLKEVNHNSAIGLLKEGGERDRSRYIIVANKILMSLDGNNFVSQKGMNQSVIYSLDEVIERVLEVVRLESICWDTWWEIPTQLRSPQFINAKRFFDILLSFVILILTFPFLILIGFFVWIFDGGPVIYTQERVGRYGELFTIYKIRTMKINSEVNGAQWAVISDARVTIIGRVLRKTRLDELPQLWNVIIGDMSLIGPRPERAEFYALINREVPQFNLRLACKPGLSGWAQVNYPYGSSVNDARIKLMYDLWYIKNASLQNELKIASRTILAMVSGSR